MRRRARHRLIGAAVLVLLGVVGFPLLFDTQPRPVPVDIPIEIPDRNKVAPLVIPASVAQAPAAKPSGTAAPASPAPANGVTEGEELVPPTRVAPPKPAPLAPARADAKPETKVEAKPEHNPAPKESKESKEPKEQKVATPPEHKPAPRTDDAARARALLEGRVPASVAPGAAATGNAEESRFIVQVGAFADPDKAREARTKVERAGMKTYMQVVDTKDGKRTRVRVGPFTTRADAEKAAARIKGLDLSASVLAL